nr:GntR family transcriptional regulator [Ammoniphilus resinae]
MFEQVAKQIVSYIAAEQLPEGSKIPTERNLSELLEVSRSSVREGLRVLELLRFLESKQGEGTFVAEPPPFLIPHLVIAQPLHEAAQRHYFGVLIMCAETIVFLSLQKQIDGEMRKTDNPWMSLKEWIVSISTQIENPYYVSLFTDIFDLLWGNDYFSSDMVPDLEELIMLYRQGNQLGLREWFSRLA